MIRRTITIAEPINKAVQNARAVILQQNIELDYTAMVNLLLGTAFYFLYKHSNDEQEIAQALEMASKLLGNDVTDIMSPSILATLGIDLRSLLGQNTKTNASL